MKQSLIEKIELTLRNGKGECRQTARNVLAIVREEIEPALVRAIVCDQENFTLRLALMALQPTEEEKKQ